MVSWRIQLNTGKEGKGQRLSFGSWLHTQLGTFTDKGVLKDHYIA